MTLDVEVRVVIAKKSQKGWLKVRKLQDQQKMAKVGLEMKLLTSEVDAEAEKWDEYAENDIVKRAKSMSSMAYNMYLFTRGDGPLKTTHDLFTQAEFFAEEANKMYKTVREFSYEVRCIKKLSCVFYRYKLPKNNVRLYFSLIARMVLPHVTNCIIQYVFA